MFAFALIAATLPNPQVVGHPVDLIEFNRYYEIKEATPATPEQLRLIFVQVVLWRHVVEARQTRIGSIDIRDQAGAFWVDGNVHYLDGMVPIAWHFTKYPHSITKRGDWYFVTFDIDDRVVVYRSRRLEFTHTLHDPETESRWLGQTSWGLKHK